MVSGTGRSPIVWASLNRLWPACFEMASCNFVPMSGDETLSFEHEDIQSLLGAYALDAVDAEERRQVELHLRECECCREEASNHLEVAGLLTLVIEMEEHSEAVATEDLIDDVVVPFEAPTSRRRSRVLELTSIAAVAVLLAGFIVQTVRLGNVQEELASATAADFALAAQEAGSATYGLADVDGRLVASVVVLEDGTGLLTIEDLPSVDEGRTYQLWGVMDGEVVSVGLAGSGPGTSAFTADLERLEALVITEEEAGGVAISQEAALASWAISS